MTQTTLASTARRLIAKNGRSMTLRRQSGTPKDPQKPWRGTDKNHDNIVVTAVILNYRETDIDGDRIKRGDRLALVSAAEANMDLRQWDLLIDRNEHFRIETAELLEPGSVQILWKLQLRN